MQEYNTQLPIIKLPEYGRNVQSLVNYCKTIPDREKRNACARAIVEIMGDLYPDLAAVSGRKNILWDHLSVIANQELDIDYPCEVMQQEEYGRKVRKSDSGSYAGSPAGGRCITMLRNRCAF